MVRRVLWREIRKFIGIFNLGIWSWFALYESKNKIKLLIHAGTPKTGSTTLQKAMYVHRERLLKEGILYPDLDIEPGEMKKHQWLVRYLMANDKERLRSMFSELSKMAIESQAKMIVLSTEGVYNHWSDYSPEARGILGELADSFDVSVWCVFREPLAFAISRYGQVVKNPPNGSSPENGTSLSMEEIIQFPSFRRRLDYAGFIDGIESVFGRGSIVVTKYASADVLEQARSILGVSIDILPDVPRMNESLSAQGIDLVRRMNSLHLSEAQREKVLAEINDIDKLLGSSSGPLTASEVFRQQVKVLSANSEKILAERFGISWHETSGGGTDMNLEFVIIAEAGILEDQALMLCESIRLMSGRYASAGIVVISPRKDRRPSGSTLLRLEELNVKYVPLTVESPCPEYGTTFRVLAFAEYERMSTADVLVGLDSDTVFLAEPDLDLGSDDAAARPVDVIGMCTKGEGDPRDAYWQSLCHVCGVDYNSIPYVVSTVDRQTVKASYNGGFVVVRRSSHIFQRTADFFLKSVEAGLKPFANEGLRIDAGHGLVSVEGSEYWGSSQACLSLAIWGANLTLRTLPPSHNIPLHLYETLSAEVESGQFGTLVHIHYHNLLNDVPTEAPAFMDYPGLQGSGIAWLKEHVLNVKLKQLVLAGQLELASSREELEKIYNSNGWRILTKYYKLRDTVKRIIR